MMPNLPEGMSYGYLFNISTGRALDVYGEIHDLPRKRWWFIKEPDFLYKPRLASQALKEHEQNKMGHS